LIFSGILHLLYPFVPGYVRAILQALDFSTLYSFAFPPDFKKETLVQATGAYDLFDLLYTLRLKLDIKKHQKISIFFRADQNSLLLFQEYQEGLQKVLNIEQVQLLKLHEAEPTGYQQEIYNNITVGIKVLPPNPSSKRPVLADLERQYAQQLERFEHLRNVLANMSTYTFMNVETEQVKQKKAELEQVKEHLTQLEKIIQLLKVNGRRR
jgi:valyl-tRNA synthetase